MLRLTEHLLFAKHVLRALYKLTNFHSNHMGIKALKIKLFILTQLLVKDLEFDPRLSYL